MYAVRGAQRLRSLARRHMFSPLNFLEMISEISQSRSMFLPAAARPFWAHFYRHLTLDAHKWCAHHAPAQLPCLPAAPARREASPRALALYAGRSFWPILQFSDSDHDSVCAGGRADLSELASDVLPKITTGLNGHKRGSSCRTYTHSLGVVTPNVIIIYCRYGIGAPIGWGSQAHTFRRYVGYVGFECFLPQARL